MENISKTISQCRICCSTSLDEILALGEQPPANSLRNQLSSQLQNIPLTITRCTDCSTIQLTETINSKYLFSEYVWVTGTSSTAVKHGQFFFEQLEQRLGKKEAFIVEVASNDGTFLIPFKDAGHKILGVDPAKNIAEIANDQGVTTLADFFSKPVAKEIVKTNGKADAIFARNVIPHVEDIHGVIGGMAECLKDEGLAVIEFHYSEKILDELHYDSIYHEHLFYYSLESISKLLSKHGLYPFDIEKSPISGGSLIVYCSKNKNRITTNSLSDQILAEEKSGINTKKRWEVFADQSYQHKALLKAMVENEFAQNSKIIGYGASARSSTMLNFCEINHRHLLSIADKSPHKHNRYTPGTDILIESPDAAFERHPDVILLLAWNFKDELIEIIKNQYGFKGKVILPLPKKPELIQL